MYRKVKEEVFDGLLTAALEEYIDEADKSLPSDEELAEMYPTSNKAKRKYRQIAKSRKYNAPPVLVYFRRAVAVVLVVIAVSFGLLLINTDVRAAIFDAVVTWYDKYIQIDFGKGADDYDAAKSAVELLKIGYIPEGFELSDATEEKNSREYMYIKDDGDYMIIGIYSSDSTDIAADIEHMEYEVMTINENDAYLVYNQQERYGVIAIGNSKYTIWISAVLDKSELIKVAENIK